MLVAGDNFGCGSSREHAPWALTDYGFRAVISTRIADIFRSNALKNGLLPIVLEPAAHAALIAAPGFQVRIDLEAQTVTLPDGGTAKFPIESFSRYCLHERRGRARLPALARRTPSPPSSRRYSGGRPGARGAAGRRARGARRR